MVDEPGLPTSRPVTVRRLTVRRVVRSPKDTAAAWTRRSRSYARATAVWAAVTLMLVVSHAGSVAIAFGVAAAVLSLAVVMKGRVLVARAEADLAPASGGLPPATPDMPAPAVGRVIDDYRPLATTSVDAQHIPASGRAGLIVPGMPVPHRDTTRCGLCGQVLGYEDEVWRFPSDVFGLADECAVVNGTTVHDRRLKQQPFGDQAIAQAARRLRSPAGNDL
jgi:hypothetical protein